VAVTVRRAGWRLARAWPVVAACALIGVLTGANRPGATPPLFAAGVLANGHTLAGVSARDAEGAAWLDSSSVLRLADGRLRWLPPGAGEPVDAPSDDPDALAAAAAERAWLAGGRLPGATPDQRLAATRALLDLRLLIRPGGAAVAAPEPYWAYVWPRDASFAAAALAVTGHRDEALAILGFLATTQRADGTWPARSRPDAGEVGDGRAPQLDATGWVPWAAWLASDGGTDLDAAERLWPVVRQAAMAAARSLRPDGLPPAGPDYRERRERQPTLGTAAPLRAGLRSAARLAAILGHRDDERVFRTAAVTLDAGMRRQLIGPGGWQRTPAGGGADQAVTWLAPPFAPAESGVRAAVAAARAELTVDGGGIVPGLPWAGADPWTPATASFALAAAGLGDRAATDRLLGWLLDHRTALGSFPERVRKADGAPRSAAPLGWTAALVVLTLSQAEAPLPVP
jgi:hypothetical protein